MQIVSLGDNLHECHIPFSGKIGQNVLKCCLLKILPRVLSVKKCYANSREIVQKEHLVIIMG